jgi:hypothetical protein
VGNAWSDGKLVLDDEKSTKGRVGIAAVSLSSRGAECAHGTMKASNVGLWSPGVADTTPYRTVSDFTVAKVKRCESEAVTCKTPRNCKDSYKIKASRSAFILITLFTQ